MTKRSCILTLRGGGGIRLPEILITLRPMGMGGGGGASRTIIGCGVMGLGGC
jgi:phage tail tape-measure protein